MKELTDGYFDPIAPSEALVQKTLKKIKRQRQSKIVYLWQCAASVAACVGVFLFTGTLDMERVHTAEGTASVFATGTPRLLSVLLLIVLLGTFTALYFHKKKQLER